MNNSQFLHVSIQALKKEIKVKHLRLEWNYKTEQNDNKTDPQLFFSFDFRSCLLKIDVYESR